MPLLDSGRRIINVDETWLNETNFTRKTRCSPQATGSYRIKGISPSLSMIAALDTDDRVFFSLSHAATDQDTFMLFLQHLIVQLDKDSPGWQYNSIILMDNAPTIRVRKSETICARCRSPSCTQHPTPTVLRQ